MNKSCYFVLLIALVLTACQNNNANNVEYKYPKAAKDVRQERVGSVTGNDDGFVIFGGKKKAAENSPLSSNVNSFLWRATLDTISFMPLESTDPIGGVIITDWYRDNATSKEKFKLNVLLRSAELQTNSIKVSVFKQTVDSKGVWHDTAANEKIARDLEDKILTRARQLKIATEE